MHCNINPFTRKQPGSSAGANQSVVLWARILYEIINLASKIVPQKLYTFRKAEVVSAFIFVSLIKIKINLLYKIKTEAYY